MNILGKHIVELLIKEAQQNITVLFPGGFKPPHGGHYELALRYSEQPNVDQVIILIGPEPRDGFTRDQSIAVWRELVKGNAKILVQKTEVNSPLAAAYKYIETAQPGTYALAASSKGDDYKRVQQFVSGHTSGGKYAREGVKVVELPLDTKPLLYKGRTPEAEEYVPGKSGNGKGISASVLRVDLAKEDIQAVKTNYPNITDPNIIVNIYKILTKKDADLGKLSVSEGIALSDLLTKLKTRFKDFVQKISQEKEETKQAFSLIAQAAQGKKKLTPDDQKQVGDQMKDVLKTMGIGAATILPGGSIYFLMIKLLKLQKYTMPSSFVAENSNLNEGKLRVFDFDDTLVQTDAMIYVTKKNTGRKLALTPAQYATYTQDEGDMLDFSEFDSEIKSGKELKQYTSILKRVLNQPAVDRQTVVLTARGNAQVVSDFLAKIGIPKIEVIAVGSSDPQKKADWIESQINQGYEDVYFLDDSQKNIRAVDALKSKYPHIKLRTQNVIHRQPGTLMEGGAAGHLAHPYEDLDLTFGEVKDMIKAALGGTLEYAQEKLDGQNLMVTYKDGKVRAARNKGQIKNFGQNSLTTDQLSQMFAGRGAIQTAFVETMNDLETAINKLSPKEKAEFFQNGKRFISLEVLFPETSNVVPYGASQLRLHHFKEYDQEGNIIEEDVEGIYKLQQAFDKVQADQQKTFMIRTTDPAKLKADNDYEAQLKSFTDEVKSVQSRYALSDKSKVSDYVSRWWSDLIKQNAKTLNYKLPQNVLDLLIRRWAFTDKSTKITDIKRAIDNEQFRTWVEEFDKGQVESNKKIALKPIETLFLKLGVRILRNIENLTTLNPDGAKRSIKQDLSAAIRNIQKAADTETLEDNDAAIRFLKRELTRLKDIGGFEAIVPTEGLVFKYKGKLYKLTGAFAPINQILGYLRF